MVISAQTRVGAIGEWLTVLMIVCCTGGIVCLALMAYLIPLWLVIPLLAVLLAFHSSLQHEVLHGHPFRNDTLNESMVCIPFGWYIAYARFRDTHLQHHNDEYITDPYEDPESQYLDPQVWNELSSPLKWLFNINGTLCGRILVGPAIALFFFYRNEVQEILGGNRSVLRAYAIHLTSLTLWLVWLALYASIPFWAYALSAYMGLSLISVRAYLEHRADESVYKRTVIVEDRGFFALLFLNNNFHLVHHMHPKAPWYCLPGLYRMQAQRYVDRNGGYVYDNYWHVFAQYLFSRKEPIAHPLMMNPVEKLRHSE